MTTEVTDPVMAPNRAARRHPEGLEPRLDLNNPIVPAAFTINGASAYVPLGKTTLYKLISEGKLPTVRVGRRLLIRRAALDALLDLLEKESGR